MESRVDEVEIEEVTSGASLELVRDLCREYGAWIAREEGGDGTLVAQGFETELAALPGYYVTPRGGLLLARVNGEPAGCAAFRPLPGGAAELKRVYVRDRFRGASLGRRLVSEVVDRAARAGANRLCLDTLPFMRGAVRLYRSLGFEEVEPYVPNPTPGARCFAIGLEPVEPEARLVDYHPDFAADFERLNREWLEEFFTVEAKDLLFFEDPEGTIIAPGGMIKFVEEAGHRVGTCAVIRDERGGYELAKMAVARESRGKGYGQWLVTAAIAFARERGARTLYLFSDQALVDALRLYERMGFLRLPFPGNTGYERGDVFMERALT